MQNHVLIPPAQFALILDRLAHQLIEHHDFSNTDLVGLQPRGSRLAERLKERVEELLPGTEINCGKLDVTFFRDDFRTHEKPLSPNENAMDLRWNNGMWSWWTTSCSQGAPFGRAWMLCWPMAAVVCGLGGVDRPTVLPRAAH